MRRFPIVVGRNQAAFERPFRICSIQLLRYRRSQLDHDLVAFLGQDHYDLADLSLLRRNGAALPWVSMPWRWCSVVRECVPSTRCGRPPIFPLRMSSVARLPGILCALADYAVQAFRQCCRMAPYGFAQALLQIAIKARLGVHRRFRAFKVARQIVLYRGDVRSRSPPSSGSFLQPGVAVHLERIEIAITPAGRDARYLAFCLYLDSRNWLRSR